MKKQVLGKGIASLLQESSGPKVSNIEALKAMQLNNVSANQSQSANINQQKENGPLMIAIEQIKTNPNQPRKIFKERELEELAHSIKENGIIQPILVRKSDSGFELIAGERRLRAAKKAGLEYVPAIIKNTTEKDRSIIALIENIQRADLNCVEEALAYYQLLNDYQMTQEELSKKLGKDRSTIANFLRILKLPRQVIEQLQKEQLTFGHAKILAGLEDREEIIRFANLSITEQWSVRELEEKTKRKSKAKLKDEKENNFEQKYDSLRQKIEQKSGLHVKIKSNNKGAGLLSFVFSNEAEFNDIFTYFMDK